MIGDCFLRVRQHHRAAAEHRAQEDLQAAVAAHVIERGPDRRRTWRWPFRKDCPGKPGERVTDDLRCAGRAGREQQPFGLGSDRGWTSRLHRQPSSNDQGNAEVLPEGGVVADHGVNLGIGNHRREMFGPQVRRTQQHAAHDAIEFEHHKRGGELICHRDQHRSAGKFRGTAGKNAAGHQIGDGNDRASVGQRATRSAFSQMVSKRHRECGVRGSMPSLSSSRATRIAKHSESRPESSSTRSSVNDATRTCCSAAISSIKQAIVNLMDTSHSR